jgi:hypothetical protein
MACHRCGEQLHGWTPDGSFVKGGQAETFCLNGYISGASNFFSVVTKPLLKTALGSESSLAISLRQIFILELSTKHRLKVVGKHFSGNNGHIDCIQLHPKVTKFNIDLRLFDSH